MRAIVDYTAKEPKEYKGKWGQGLKIEGNEDWINIELDKGINLRDIPYMKKGSHIQLGEIENNKIHISQIQAAGVDYTPPEVPPHDTPEELSQGHKNKNQPYYESIEMICSLKPKTVTWEQWIPVIVAHINTYNFNK